MPYDNPATAARQKHVNWNHNNGIYAGKMVYVRINVAVIGGLLEYNLITVWSKGFILFEADLFA